MSEIPTHDYQCPCELCEPEAHSVRELPSQSTVPAPEGQDLASEVYRERVASGVRVSPLMRAALDNGLDFETVDLLAGAVSSGYPVFSAKTIAAFRASVEADTALNLALEQHARARQPERSRLWWRGALPQ